MTINLNEYIGTSVAIPLAKQGEYGKEVTFDFSAWVERFGSGSIGWSIQRPQDTAAYLLPSTEDGTVSTITLTETESQNSGYGLLEVFYVNTGETEKRISQTFSIRIDKSLQNVGEAPSPWQSYVDAVHADALAAEEAASSVLGLTAEATVDSSVGTPSVSVEVSTEDDHKNMAFAFSNIKGEQGDTGATGNGIANINVAKTATVGNVDTYTMTISYTDGDSDTATFDVTNGEVTEEEFEKAFPTDTASGSIASYPDGADMPVKDLKVSVTPVQDLHGYANPWVGGGGKNKLDVSLGGYTAMNTSTGEVGDANPLRWASGMVLLGAGTYTFSFGNGGFCIGIFYYNTSDAFLNYEAKSFSTNPQTITLTETQKVRVYCGATDHSTLESSVAVMQIESGSSATTYAPYSNICPITGWTGANVVRTGANLWDEQWEVGSINPSTGQNNVNSGEIRTKNYIPITPLTQYYCYVGGGDTLSNIKARFYDADKNYLGSSPYGGTFVYYNRAFTTPSTAYYMRFAMQPSYGTTYKNDISINYPSTDHEYHAYSGNTYSFSFGQTVYGGTLDVTSGVLTVDRAYADMGGMTWSAYGNVQSYGGLFYSDDVRASIMHTNNDDIFAISSAYKAVPNKYNGVIGGAFEFQNGCIRVRNGDGRVYLRNDAYLSDDGTALKSAMNGWQLVYLLASPQSVQLSPTEVKSLLGQNNIFADCGDSEVEYLADVTLYIQKLTGSTEEDMVANQNIANNKYFMVGNRLFFSTSAIAQGASIIVGTNCTETNLADALNALNS